MPTTCIACRGPNGELFHPRRVTGVGPGRAGGPCRGRRWRHDRLSLAFCAWAASSWAEGQPAPDRGTFVNGAVGPRP
jgi:hypothetical protein